MKRSVAAALVLLAACNQPRVISQGSGSPEIDVSGQDTRWQIAGAGDMIRAGHPVEMLCSQARHDELAPNNPHRWVRACVGREERSGRFVEPSFNGGLVAIDGVKVHTFKYDADPTPSGEFHVFGAPAYEMRVAAALGAAKTVTINGITLRVGPAPPEPAGPAPASEYRGEDQHQAGNAS